MDGNNPKIISLTLELSDVNKILEVLGQRPYAAVYQLIGTIQQQAAEQLNGSSNAASSTGSSAIAERPSG